MYQDKKKKGIRFGICLAGFLYCAFHFLMILFWFLLVVTNQMHGNSSILPVIGVVFSFFTIFTVILFCKLRKILRVGRFNNFFEKDEDGLVAVSDLSHELKLKPKKCISEFLEFVGNGLLVNCMIFPEDANYILLDNGRKQIKDKYVVIHCTNCAAPNTLRIGYEHNCKYCGTQLLDK